MTAPDPATSLPKKTTWSRLKIFTVFLLDLILPAFLAGTLVLLVFSYYRFWGLNRPLILILYGAAVVAAALLLSLLFIFVLPPFRTLFSRVRNVTFRRGILLLGGVVVPGLLLVAANFYLLPDGHPAMTALLSAAVSSVPATPADDVGELALQTQNSATKVLSIGVLKGFHTPEALARLVRLAREDPLAVQDAATRDALAGAIASYGTDAKPAMLSWFNSIHPSQPETAPAGGGDFYARYFSQPFESLKNEINSATLNPAEKEARLGQLAGAEQQLRAALSGLENYPAPPLDEARQDLALQVFLQMDLKEDAGLLNLARTVAASPAYPDRVRGDALLLIAKLGAAGDLTTLYPYIHSETPLLQARALTAIAALQQKSAQPAAK